MWFPLTHLYLLWKTWIPGDSQGLGRLENENMDVALLPKDGVRCQQPGAQVKNTCNLSPGFEPWNPACLGHFSSLSCQRARKQSKKKTHLSWKSSGAFSTWKSCGKYRPFSLFCRVFTARGDNQAQTYYIQIIHLISFWQLLVSLLLLLFQTDKYIFLWLLCKRMSLFTALMPNLQPSSFPCKIKGKYIWSRKLQIN